MELRERFTGEMTQLRGAELDEFLSEEDKKDRPFQAPDTECAKGLWPERAAVWGKVHFPKTAASL